MLSLIERLRANDGWTQQKPYWHNRNPDGPEAADHIERLEAQLTVMREALGKAGLAFRSIRYHADNGHQDRPVHVRLRLISEECNSALESLAALSQEPKS